MSRTGFIGIAAVSVILGGCSSANLPSTKIYFASDRDGQLAIFMMDANGSHVQRLTDPAFISTRPSLSRDGTKVVFQTSRDGNPEIYVMNTDGTNQMRLTDDPANDLQPSFSYDGTMITFASSRSGNSDIYVMNSDGSNVRRVTSHSAADLTPKFNPAGDKIAFTSQRGQSPEIFLVNVDGSHENQISQDANTSNTAPCFMHDGQSLLMAEYTPTTGQSRVIRLYLSNFVELPLMTGRNDIRTISLSPDGTHLAYTIIVGSAGDIYRSTLGGTGNTNLTHNAAQDEGASFGP
jgi:Tol biopolymer transport system component